MTFDRDTHDLWFADVGLNLREEVNVQPASSTGGENYGWSRVEGDICYDPPTGCDEPTDVDPVYVYPHGPGCSVNGGYVYRGSAIPGLQGLYFFSDWCTSDIWTFRYHGSELTELTNRSDELAPPPGDAFSYLVGFGQDAAGELYVIDWHWNGTNDGQIFKIVPDVVDVADATPVVGPHLTVVMEGPNPFPHRARVALSAPGGGRADLEIHDAAGRRIWTGTASVPATGSTWVEWDGIDAGGTRQPSGMYFLTASLGDRSVTRRLVLVR